MKNQKNDLRTLTQLALLIAILLVMKLTGLGWVPVGPLHMSFLTLPVAVGAVVLGPMQGAVLGAVFGLVSFYDAITGASAMTGAFFQIKPVHTFVLCVGMRLLMGLCCGLLYAGCRQLDKIGSWSYLAGALSAPLLNTLFFMGYICLVFYGTDYVQNLVAANGASNPVTFVIALVGIQGLVEAVAVGVLGTAVSKAVDLAMGRRKAAA